jgi:hypothetical protein
MSTEAYNRAIARESKIWTPFSHLFPSNVAQVAARVIIYGLYSGAYQNQHDYLYEIEAADLANLLNDYQAKLAALTNEEQIVVADIVSKRYLASIDKIIHDQQMSTEQAKINSASAEMDAKIAALAADEAALVTLATKVAAETAKTQARITELEAQIEIEAVNLTLAEVEILEKELQASKVDLAKQQVQSETLKIQMDTVLASLELVDVDLQIARTKVDQARVDAAVAKIGLLKSELKVAQAQTEIALGEVNIASQRVALTIARGQNTDREVEYYNNEIANEIESRASKSALEGTQLSLKLSGYEQQTADRLANIDTRTNESNIGPVFAEEDATLRAEIDSHAAEEYQTTEFHRRNRKNAVISNAEIMAAAKIATTLIHTIGKAPTT